MDWTNNAAIRLVKEYQKHPELWDSSHEMYRVSTLKHEAWEELANTFRCETLNIKKKMNSLLSSHRRERAKVRSGRQSSWFLYKHMKFLPTHVHSDAVSDEQAESVHEEYLEDIPDDDLTDFNVSNDDVHEEIIIKEEEIPVPKKSITYRETSPVVKVYNTHKPRLTKTIKRRSLPTKKLFIANDNDNINTRVNLVKRLRKSDVNNQKDECDSFGEYIANSLRKHDERSRSMIKHAINNILFEQEMKKYTPGSMGQYEIAVVEDADENPLILGDHIEEN